MSLIHLFALPKKLCPEYSLEENYWVHVKLFPGTASQYSTKVLKLFLRMAHAGERGNLLFANVSEADTFRCPYLGNTCFFVHS